MNQQQATPPATYIPPLRIGHLVHLVVDNLGKEDAESFLQTCAHEDVQKVIATLENILKVHFMQIAASDGVTAESLDMVRSQVFATSSVLTELTTVGALYAQGKHPRFMRVQDEA